jgi:hypothetical protein
MRGLGVRGLTVALGDEIRSVFEGQCTTSGGGGLACIVNVRRFRMVVIVSLENDGQVVIHRERLWARRGCFQHYKSTL